MTYKIIPTKKFGKELKRLVKKYPSLKSEFASLIYSLEKNPIKGVSLGNNCYKIRLAIFSKGGEKWRSKSNNLYHNIRRDCLSYFDF